MDSAKLTGATSGFVLAAAVTVLINTALACAKDVSAPLRAFMKALAGHDWTTQGLFDITLFVALGFMFTNTRIAEKLDSSRLIATLIGAVVIAGLGLIVWFGFT